ncbi:uncharacterized protein J4E88_008773 [Alternaria novae-zelandiae]|uniref:uncharacterized protein n=1 Tax=Alternaria novae-zelandiae TaxID=430562 RepID=UPI0020C2CA64|nr:uncharacterized protein J4E88_008773 [Alternaria novae-zelandiae]KAI4673716.1 hypothetical protein J4E88_008773 [Alternaria novae-zelandiae]
MANGWAPIIGLIVTVIFCGAAWFLAPKGENQTYVPTISSSSTKSPPKSPPAPPKPCLRDENENAREKLLAVCKKRGAGDGRRVRFSNEHETSQDMDVNINDSDSELRRAF